MRGEHTGGWGNAARACQEFARKMLKWWAGPEEAINLVVRGRPKKRERKVKKKKGGKKKCGVFSWGGSFYLRGKKKN